MKIKSVEFYKRLILIIVGFIIVVPMIACIILAINNAAMRKKLNSAALVSDDAVTVGATELEPAGIVREKPVLSYQMLYPDFKASFFGFNENLAGNKTVFLTFDDGPSAGTDQILDVLKKRGVLATFFCERKIKPPLKR